MDVMVGGGLGICGYCGADMSGLVTPLQSGGELPSVGDYSVCDNCGELFVFASGPEGGMVVTSCKPDDLVGVVDRLVDLALEMRRRYKAGQRTHVYQSNLTRVVVLGCGCPECTPTTKTTPQKN